MSSRKISDANAARALYLSIKLQQQESINMSLPIYGMQEDKSYASLYINGLRQVTAIHFVQKWQKQYMRDNGNGCGICRHA